MSWCSVKACGKEVMPNSGETTDRKQTLQDGSDLTSCFMHEMESVDMYSSVQG